MHILTVDNISKSYGDKTLFENVSFSINTGEKIGLIGVNGTGKSTLLKILAGLETQDSGDIIIPNGIVVEYLNQSPDFDDDETVLEFILKSDTPENRAIKEYESILNQISSNPEDMELQNRLNKASNLIDSLGAWEFESQIKTILTKLGIDKYHDQLKTLSGGERKRVALAASLLSDSDLLILDEPTNHMDNESINWLEKYLMSAKKAILMVTHDRYFLDRVVNKTLELDFGALYTYKCNYSQFVELKIERKEMESSMERKRLNLYRRELNWIRTGARARTTKQKARIQRFNELEKASYVNENGNVEMDFPQTRLGRKTLELENISKSFGERKIIDNFSYVCTKEDRIGIVGNNGMGKSTLLNIITGALKADGGEVVLGDTVKVGYFSQESEALDPNLRAIEYIKDIAEYYTGANNKMISAAQLMETFLFNKDMQWTYISKLSGGEKRRLYLLGVLMEGPNILILDEPTNDLDIDTLKVLETYIDNFNGIVLAVSHDRYFLDRITNRIFSFEGDGKIQVHTGNYSDYVDFKKLETALNPASKAKAKEVKPKETQKEEKKKLTYKEKIELKGIDSEIEALEEKLSTLEVDIEASATDYGTLSELVKEKDAIEEELLFKMERKEYLDEIDGLS